jgi:hypothetical protein
VCLVSQSFRELSEKMGILYNFAPQKKVPFFFSSLLLPLLTAPSLHTSTTLSATFNSSTFVLPFVFHFLFCAKRKKLPHAPFFPFLSPRFGGFFTNTHWAARYSPLAAVPLNLFSHRWFFCCCEFQGQELGSRILNCQLVLFFLFLGCFFASIKFFCHGCQFFSSSFEWCLAWLCFFVVFFWEQSSKSVFSKI